MVDRGFDDDERLIHDLHMQALFNVENKIASAEDRGLQQGLEQAVARLLAHGMNEEACRLTGLSKE